jgi:hypothetical protein
MFTILWSLFMGLVFGVVVLTLLTIIRLDIKRNKRELF